MSDFYTHWTENDYHYLPFQQYLYPIFKISKQVTFGILEIKQLEIQVNISTWVIYFDDFLNRSISYNTIGQTYAISGIIIWVKVFKNRPSKTCGRQSLKNFTWSILEYLSYIICTIKNHKHMLNNWNDNWWVIICVTSTFL